MSVYGVAAWHEEFISHVNTIYPNVHKKQFSIVVIKALKDSFHPDEYCNQLSLVDPRSRDLIVETSYVRAQIH